MKQNQPEDWAILEVGRAVLSGLKSPEYMVDGNPMPCWYAVLERIRAAPDDENAARIIQAVSECLTTDLNPGSAKPEQRVA